MPSNNSTERKQIATRLKEARMLAGLSQNQVAEKLDIPRPAVSEIEAGKRKVSAEEIIQFADLYKVRASWLLQEQEETIMDEQLQFAARELSKLKPEDRQKLLQILKILPS